MQTQKRFQVNVVKGLSDVDARRGPRRRVFRWRRRTSIYASATVPAKKAVIVGAGPAGTVAALILGRHGFDVQVLFLMCVNEASPSNDHLDLTCHLE